MLREFTDTSFSMLLDRELSLLLSQNWIDYNNKKLSDDSEVNYFYSGSAWEIDYLVKKINSTFPKYTLKNTRRAINIVCLASYSPMPRKLFLEQVLGILYLL